MCNADNIEKEIQQALLDLGVREDQRMFKHAGRGTAKPRSVEKGVPHPTYCCLLTCNVSMSAAGLRLGTEADRKPKRGGKQKAKGKDKNTSNTTPITFFFSSKPQQKEKEDEEDEDEDEDEEEEEEEEEGVF